MTAPGDTPDLAARLAAAWPPAAWGGVHVLAAVSGGADSMALLRAMLAARRTVGGAGRVFVGHVNHRLRGAESDADEAWLRTECERLGTPLLVRRADDAAAAAGASRSEEAARTLRYQRLAEIADAVGARFVAVAHTRDDQIETVLFRLLRGSGLRGLAGMPATRPLSSAASLVRPLLDCRRDELRAYLAAIGQTWREDATNANVQFSRNRLRHEVLPQLRELFAVDDALLRVAAQAAEAEAAIASLVEPLLAECGAEATPAHIRLEAAPLRRQPAIVAAEAMRAAWRSAGWPEQAMNRRWWTALAELAQTSEERPALNLPGNVLARREGSALRLVWHAATDVRSA